MEKDSLGANLRRILEDESEKKGPGGALRLLPDSPGETSEGPLDPPRISQSHKEDYLKKVVQGTLTPARERGRIHEVHPYH